MSFVDTIHKLHGCCPITCNLAVVPDIDPERITCRWTFKIKGATAGYSQSLRQADLDNPRTLEVMRDEMDAAIRDWAGSTEQ